MCCVVFVLYTAKLIVAINFFSVLFCSVHRKLWQFQCGPVYSITSCQWKQYTKISEMLIRNSEKVITMNWPCAEYFLRNIHVFFLAFCCNEEATKFNPYHSGLLHWHWGNHEITPVAVKQTLWILVNQSSKNDVRTYTKKKLTLQNHVYIIWDILCLVNHVLVPIGVLFILYFTTNLGTI